MENCCINYIRSRLLRRWSNGNGKNAKTTLQGYSFLPRSIWHGILNIIMVGANKIRPVRIIFLATLVICFAAWNGLRLGETIFFWKTLQEYGASSVYISISGAFWLIMGLLLVWGLWQGKTWAWPAALGSTVGYIGWYWFDRLVLQQPHANWPFVLVFDIVFLFLILINLFSSKSRRFFSKRCA